MRNLILFITLLISQVAPAYSQYYGNQPTLIEPIGSGNYMTQPLGPMPVPMMQPQIMPMQPMLQPLPMGNTYSGTGYPNPASFQHYPIQQFGPQTSVYRRW